MSMAKSMGPGKKTTTSKVKEPEDKYLCYYCGEKKRRSEFYVSTDPFNAVGIIPYCKKCVEKIARNYNENYKWLCHSYFAKIWKING